VTFFKGGNLKRAVSMAKRPNIIPKAPLARVLMNAGAKRVSAAAVDVFADILEERTEKIASQASKIAKHSGRKTVQEEDIKLATKQM
jgi:histone H3/H4